LQNAERDFIHEDGLQTARELGADYAQPKGDCFTQSVWRNDLTAHDEIRTGGTWHPRWGHAISQNRGLSAKIQESEVKMGDLVVSWGWSRFM